MEELINPQQQLPRIVLTSLGIVTTAYLLVNIAYFSVLDVTTIQQSRSVAVDMGRAIEGVGPGRGYSLVMVLALGVVVSTAGSNNGSIMTGGRAFYAVARGGHAPQCLVSWMDK